MKPFANNIVAAFGMTHTPGLGNLTHLPPADQMERLYAGFDVLKKQVAEAKPDVVIVISDDHFDMFNLQAMPPFAMGVGPMHYGPTLGTEQWIQQKRGPIPGHAPAAMGIYKSLLKHGIEPLRFEQGDLVHNVLLPKRYVWPDLDIPLIPILVNCFAPPLPTWRRAYEFGVALNKAIAERPERIAIVASGGVSHWPPISPEDYPEGDPMRERTARYHMLGQDVFKEDPTLHMEFVEREKAMAMSGRELVNVAWDKLILEKLAQADIDYLVNVDNDEITKISGSGATEMMMWATLVGAVGSIKGDIVFYEHVKEWMGGVAAISYDKALRSA